MLAKYIFHNNSLYNKLVELSRNIYFYNRLSLKDNFETRIMLIMVHLSIILIVFKEKNKSTFPQNIFDNIFLNIEYHLRESGHGDVVKNKKMKLITRIFYNILLKLFNKNKVINNDLLNEYFLPTSNNKQQIGKELADYFDDFYNFCFELDNNSVLKGQINFKY